MGKSRPGVTGDSVRGRKGCGRRHSRPEVTPDPSNTEEGSTSSEESYQKNAGVRRSQGSAADNTICPQCG